MSRIVIAVGGNAIEPRVDPAAANDDEGAGRAGREAQRGNLHTAADVIAELSEHELVLTHGNGPQVGRLALEAELSGSDEPLDVLGAVTEGMMGYALELGIRSRLPTHPIVTLLTQVEVDPDDPAFASPSKPIGPMYEESRAEALAEERGWSVASDGAGWRRVVPSPRPLRIFQLDAIRVLLDARHIVVCGGGGGIPVVMGEDGEVWGREAVVDKDHSSALIAAGIDADVLLLLTDVSAIFEDWPECQRPIRSITSRELKALELPGGSMGPKAAAAASFVEATGRVAIIGALDEAAAMLEGEAGTRVEPGSA